MQGNIRCCSIDSMWQRSRRATNNWFFFSTWSCTISEYRDRIKIKACTEGFMLPPLTDNLSLQIMQTVLKFSNNLFCNTLGLDNLVSTSSCGSVSSPVCPQPPPWSDVENRCPRPLTGVVGLCLRCVKRGKWNESQTCTCIWSLRSAKWNANWIESVLLQGVGGVLGCPEILGTVRIGIG
jgi:hypothetical protein